MKHRIFRLLFYGALAMIVVAGVTFGTLLLAVNVKPEHYAKSLAVEPAKSKQDSQKAVVKSKEEFKELTPSKRDWKTELTEDEVNGYLAVELLRDYPKILPKEIKNPRVSLKDDNMELACQVRYGSFSGVVNLTLDVQMPKPNRCEIRFLGAHLGLFPFSRETIRDLLADGFQKSGAKVEKSMDQDVPKLSVEFKIPIKEKKVALLFKELQFRHGSLSYSGAVEKLK